MDKYSQLVKDLKTNKLTMLHIRQAIRQYYRDSPHIPEEAKTILCGTSNDSGLISKVFNLMSGIIGGMELVYLRTKQGTTTLNSLMNTKAKRPKGS
jgi:hypothetical protein